MDSIAIHFLEENGTQRALLKELRDASNPMELSDTNFIKKFRLSKDAFKYLLDEFKKFAPKPSRSSTIPPILKIAAALRFFAQGSYQENVGESYLISMSQPTFSIVLSQVLDFFQERMCSKWINYRMDVDEKKEAKHSFYVNTGFPGVIGCIDGTHVQIIRPNENEHLFYGKEGCHTINVMIACDHKMRIRCVDGKFAGASHDSLVWNLSNFRRHLLETNRADQRSWLLGDSAYPLEPWLITPYRSAPEGSRNAKFNEIHCKTRNIIERTIGLLKSRFRCISRERVLHYQPLKVTKIINACCALHNIAIFYRVEFSEDLVVEEYNTEGNQNSQEDAVAVRLRDEIRNSICQ